MASKNFGDDFRGTGALTGSPSLASGIAGASWSTVSTAGGWSGSLFQRSAGGLQLEAPLEGEDRIARLAFTAFALGTASGVAVFEWRVRADVLGGVGVGLSTTRYAQLVLNGGTGTATVFNVSSSSVGVSGMPTSGYMVIRVELSTTNTKFYCNGTLLTTISIGWSDTTTINRIEYVTYSYAPLVEGVTDTVADYFNAKTETTSGALGGPSVPAGDTTPPTLAGPITFPTVTTHGFMASWSGGSDDVAITGYEYSFNGTTYTDIEANTSFVYTSGVAGETITVSVRAYDAAGNRSTAITGSVTLQETETPPAPPIITAQAGDTLIADTFSGDALVVGSFAQIAIRPTTWAASELTEGGYTNGGIWRSPAGAITTASVPHRAVSMVSETYTSYSTAAARLVVEMRVGSDYVSGVGAYGVSFFLGAVYLSASFSGGLAQIKCIHGLELPGRWTDVVATAVAPTSLHTVRYELSATQAWVYIDGTLATTFSISASGTAHSVSLGASNTVIGFTPVAGGVLLEYVNVKLVPPDAPHSALGKPKDTSAAPSPGNEPDRSAPPFSDFWTRFNNTYEVP